MTQNSWGFDTVNNPGGDATAPVSDVQLADFFHTSYGGGQADAGVFAVAFGGLVPDIPPGTTSRIRLQAGRALVHGRPFITDAVEVLVTVAANQNTRRRVVVESSLTTGDTNYKRNRFVILNGTGGSLTPPVLTQQARGVWQIPICAFTVGSGGAISDLADERLLIGTLAPMVAGSVTATAMADNSVTARTYAAKSIPVSAFQDNGLPGRAYAAKSIPAAAYKDNSFPERAYVNNTIPGAAVKNNQIGKGQVSEDIVRRHSSGTWNTVRDMTEAEYNALSTKHPATFYSVDG